MAVFSSTACRNCVLYLGKSAKMNLFSGNRNGCLEFAHAFVEVHPDNF